ncbi:hypothetical protein C8F01DRAFT_1127522 [Mycena amicta]|nr:hypothetical protein C8F01DRAFT_1127522 [Mycena amicta]
MGAEHRTDVLPPKQSRRSLIVAALDSLASAFGRILRILRLSHPSSPSFYAPPEKTALHPYHLHADLTSCLKRREALEDEFEAKVLAFLVPIRKALTEMAHDTTPTPPYHPPDLPSAPQLFYGRDDELSSLTRHLTTEGQARVAIVGPEGMGKSALALSVLHRPEIVSHYGGRRFLVRYLPSDDGVSAVLRLASQIGLQVHVPSESETLVSSIVASLSACAFASLIVLDDLVPHNDALFNALSAIPRVSLLLSIREPHHLPHAFVSRSSVLHLAPLSLAASRALFHTIADIPTPSPEHAHSVAGSIAAPVEDPQPITLVDALLRCTSLIPHAIISVAQRAQYEPLPFLLARCVEESADR